MTCRRRLWDWHQAAADAACSAVVVRGRGAGRHRRAERRLQTGYRYRVDPHSC
jgi:hypothetical protein